MRDVWYADNRDLIKWGVLFRLAERYEALRIIQIVYYRPSTFAQIEIDGQVVHARTSLATPGILQSWYSPFNQGASSWHVYEILVENTTGGSIFCASIPAVYPLGRIARVSVFRSPLSMHGGSASLLRSQRFPSRPSSFRSTLRPFLAQSAQSPARESRSIFQTTSGFAWTLYPSPNGFVASPLDWPAS